MKKRFLVGFLIFLTFSAFAGPFGLRMGMSLDEITDVCNGVEPVFIEKDFYSFTPVKTHPLFKYYYIHVDPAEGLYCIRVLTDDIKPNEYGTELKDSFAEIKNRIEKVYGKPRIVDEIDPNSYYKDDNEWFRALAQGARRYFAVWETSNKNKLKDDLELVGIMAKTYGPDYSPVGYIALEYYFLNTESVEDSQDDVF